MLGDVLEDKIAQRLRGRDGDVQQVVVGPGDVEDAYHAGMRVRRS